jgi:hypothetical protein
MFKAAFALAVLISAASTVFAGISPMSVPDRPWHRASPLPHQPSLVRRAVTNTNISSSP